METESHQQTPETANPEQTNAPAADMAAPPPTEAPTETHKDTVESAKPEPQPQPQKVKTQATSDNGVTAAVIVTVSIVIGLSVLALVAYTKG